MFSLAGQEKAGQLWAVQTHVVHVKGNSGYFAVQSLCCNMVPIQRSLEILNHQQKVSLLLCAVSNVIPSGEFTTAHNPNNIPVQFIALFLSSQMPSECRCLPQHHRPQCALFSVKHSCSSRFELAADSPDPTATALTWAGWTKDGEGRSLTETLIRTGANSGEQTTATNVIDVS